MTLDFQTFNLTQKAESGGGSGTTNHAQLSNLDYASSGHTGFMSDENFLSVSTITVELDGSGDFNTLAEAVNYLNNKWSYDGVLIQLGEGTHVVNTSINLGVFITNSNRFFKFITIKGKGNDKTTIRNAGNGYCLEIGGNVPIHIYDLTFDNGTNTSANCISIYKQGNLILDNTDFKNMDLACYAHSGGNILLSLSTITFTNVSTALRANAGTINITYNVAISFSSVTNAFQVGYGGIIRGYAPRITYTNVTNKTNQAVGNATSNGWIAGITA